jgi:ubiquinol-cytochrome c reductase cytochrome b subunit
VPSSLFEMAARNIDRRLGLSQPGRKAANKVFPHHWSFLLGELALFSFLLLALTGIFLTMFYRPNIAPVVYTGTSSYYHGAELPAAYASIVQLSNDVPIGDLFRRIHRFAAHLFVASTILHGARVFLTGAFRKPREINYLLGLLLLLLATGSAYTGQILPYDVIAGFTLRVSNAVLVSVPYIGPHLATGVFGGEYLTAAVLHRMYILHVLVFPGLIGGVVALHVAMLARQQHTQFRDRRVDGRRTVVGVPMWPWQFVTSTSLVLVTLVAILVASSVAPWSGIQLNGPYLIGHTSNAAQPDWWLMWIEGAMRILPAVELHLLGTVISQVFLAGMGLPALLFGALIAYPYLERRIRPYEGEQHVLDRPFDVPLRLGLFTAVSTALVLLTAAAAADYIVRLGGFDLRFVIWAFRIATVVLPVTFGILVAAYARRRKQT